MFYSRWSVFDKRGYAQTKWKRVGLTCDVPSAQWL
jgi:hypothetical protein